MNLRVLIGIIAALLLINALAHGESADKIIIFCWGTEPNARLSAEAIAASIQKNYQRQGKNIRTRVVDIQDFSLVAPLEETRQALQKSSRAFADLPQQSNYFTWQRTRHPQKIPSHLNLLALARFLGVEQAKAVITSSWDFAQGLYLLKKAIPSFTSLPCAWLRSDYDTFKYGEIAGAMHFTSSIVALPFDEISYLTKLEPQRSKVALGLRPEAKSILFAQGSEAHPQLTTFSKEIAKALRAEGIDFQLLLFASPSLQAEANYQELLASYGADTIKRLEFQGQMNHRYLHSADLLITTAGGLGLTLAALMHKPLLLIPGRGAEELHNKDVFVSQGLALAGESPEDLGRKALSLLGDQAFAGIMRGQQAAFAREHSSSPIAQWAEAVETTIPWEQIKQGVEKIESQNVLSKFLPQEISFSHHWYLYLAEIVAATASNDKGPGQLVRKRAEQILQRGFNLGRTKIEHYLRYVKGHPQERSKKALTIKWRLFETIVADQALHFYSDVNFQHSQRYFINRLFYALLRDESDQLLSNNPETWNYSRAYLYFLRAQFCYNEFSYFDGLGYSEQALALSPDLQGAEEFVLLQGKLLARIGEYGQAKKFLAAQLRRYPDQREVRLTLSALHEVAHHHEQAVSTLAPLLVGGQQLSEFDYYTLALVYLNNQARAQALAVLEQACTQHPRSVILLSLLIHYGENPSEYRRVELENLLRHKDFLSLLSRRSIS